MGRSRRRVYAVRAGVLLAGALPVLAFPRAGLDRLAWVALVPALLLIRAAPSGRAAAARGWLFGTGFIMAATYWLVPEVGPALVLLGAAFGVLWAGWALAAWALLRSPVRLRYALAALAVLPSAWVMTGWARSWQGLGGPWALYGATQWRHPAVLGLAALGGIWLVTVAVVAVNTAVTIAVVATGAPMRLAFGALAAVIAVAGPVSYALRAGPTSGRHIRVALVQPGVISNPSARLKASERITAGLPRADLIVWGESSVGFDLDERPDLVHRLSSLAAAHHAALLVNEDARNAHGRLSKSAVLIDSSGIEGRYVKTRLVPFGEYIPLHDELGWLAGISKAARRNRVPGTGARVMRADGMTFGPLICFESTFPDLGRAVVRLGARLIVYQSSTSTFQHTWAPAQHASLGAIRAAETGRPVVQAALTGVSVAYDARGRRLAWFDTDRRGGVVVNLTVPPASTRTPYDRMGDYVPWTALAVTVTAVVCGWWARRSRRRRAASRGPAGM